MPGPTTACWTRSGNELRFTRVGEDACPFTAGYWDFLEGLQRGIAAHHAGLVGHEAHVDEPHERDGPCAHISPEMGRSADRNPQPDVRPLTIEEPKARKDCYHEERVRAVPR